MGDMDDHQARRFRVTTFVDELVGDHWVKVAGATSDPLRAIDIANRLVFEANHMGGVGHDVWAAWKRRKHDLRE